MASKPARRASAGTTRMRRAGIGRHVDDSGPPVLAPRPGADDERRRLGPRYSPGGIWDACGMPWVPELFTAPALQRLLDKQQRDAIVDVPFFDGLTTGDLDALVNSFAGEPEL